MERIDTDIIIIGAGMAGVGVAADLSRDHSVVIVEMEDRPAYHATGRSAAIFIQNYGNAVIRALSRYSGPVLASPDPSLFSHPLLSPRGKLTVADAQGVAHHRALLAEADGQVLIDPAEAVAMVPILRRAAIAEASWEADARDIDVHALHQGWLRAARAGGATVLTAAEILRGTHAGGRWTVETGTVRLRAPIVVDAAGAWADRVAERLGVGPLGMQPMRRSIAVLPGPGQMDCRAWPLFEDAAETWYVKPDGGTLLVSPAEEIPCDPHDAFVDDLVLAEGLDRYQRMVTTPVTRVERSWAGLRTFAPDRTPVVGFDPDAGGFFWLAGQGGYGIQTSPALSALAAALIRRASIPGGLDGTVTALSPARFRGASPR